MVGARAGAPTQPHRFGQRRPGVDSPAVVGHSSGGIQLASAVAGVARPASILAPDDPLARAAETGHPAQRRQALPRPHQAHQLPAHRPRCPLRAPRRRRPDPLPVRHTVRGGAATEAAPAMDRSLLRTGLPDQHEGRGAWRGCRPTATWSRTSVATPRPTAPTPTGGPAAGKRWGCWGDGWCAPSRS